MKITIGLAQTLNSTDLDKNFSAIMDLLERFRAACVDLVLFPECSLSGFSAKMSECTPARLNPYFEKIQAWTSRSGMDVVLPTAFAENGRVFNCGRWFSPFERTKFYKIGLTDSEKAFFNLPLVQPPKVFEARGFRFAILICLEAQHEPWKYFKQEEADVILWPSYWGWKLGSDWGSEKESGEPNPIFSNMKHWKMPVLQANFAFNDLDGYEVSGPEGLSFVIDYDNILVAQGPHKQIGGLLVKLEKEAGATKILSCLPL